MMAKLGKLSVEALLQGMERATSNVKLIARHLAVRFVKQDGGQRVDSA